MVAVTILTQRVRYTIIIIDEGMFLGLLAITGPGIGKPVGIEAQERIVSEEQGTTSGRAQRQLNAIKVIAIPEGARCRSSDCSGA